MMFPSEEPSQTQTIEINIVVTVSKRDSYQESIEKIMKAVTLQFPELNTGSMNSPLRVRIKIK